MVVKLSSFAQLSYMHVDLLFCGVLRRCVRVSVNDSVSDSVSVSVSDRVLH